MSRTTSANFYMKILLGRSQGHRTAGNPSVAQRPGSPPPHGSGKQAPAIAKTGETSDAAKAPGRASPLSAGAKRGQTTRKITSMERPPVVPNPNTAPRRVEVEVIAPPPPQPKDREAGRVDRVGRVLEGTPGRSSWGRGTSSCSAARGCPCRRRLCRPRPPLLRRVRSARGCSCPARHAAHPCSLLTGRRLGLAHVASSSLIELEASILDPFVLRQSDVRCRVAHGRARLAASKFGQFRLRDGHIERQEPTVTARFAVWPPSGKNPEDPR